MMKENPPRGILLGLHQPPAKAVLRKCEFCGFPFPEELGRYGCPDCNGEGPEKAA